MTTRISVFGLALALPALLAATEAAQAQAGPGLRRAPQDTVRQMGPARRGAWPRRAGGFGLGMGPMQGAHIGPRMALGLKDELGLSEDQTSQLEELHEDHHAEMMTRVQRLRDLGDSIRAARVRDDWTAAERRIDEAAELGAEMAKSRLSIERATLELLTDDQREKLETWQEGHRLFRRERLHRWQGMHGRGMRDRGMHRRGGAAPPPPER